MMNLFKEEKIMKDIKIFLRKKKNRKQVYGREQYKNLSEFEKQGQLSIEKDMKC